MELLSKIIKFNHVKNKTNDSAHQFQQSQTVIYQKTNNNPPTQHLLIEGCNLNNSQLSQKMSKTYQGNKFYSKVNPLSIDMMILVKQVKPVKQLNVTFSPFT